MHITYLTSEFMTEKLHGGLAVYLENIASIMSAHGHKITIITLSDYTGRILYNKNIEVIRVRNVSSHSAVGAIGEGMDSLGNSWNMFKTLCQENKRHKIDIVQTANYRAIGFFRSYKLPTVVRASSDSAFWRNAGYYSFEYRHALGEKKLEDYLELWSVKHADAAFAPSRFCASVIGKRAGREISVIESPYFSGKCEMDDSVYQEKLLQKKYLLFNSSLSRLKGTHIGIQAAGKLLEKYPDLYMVYAGRDCGLRQQDGNVQSVSEILRKQNKQYGGRVIYLGMLSHEKLFPIVQNAAGCVLPSRVDNLPNSCIEAMSLGSIVIGTYGASFEQLIKNKENGLLIKRDSSASLIHAVDYLMGMSEEEQVQMKEKSIRSINRLNPEKVYEKMMVLYEKTIEEFKSRLI